MAVVTKDCTDCNGVGTAGDFICYPCQGVGKLTYVDQSWEPLELFGANCEIGAALTLVRSMGYHEGFENGRVIKSICEGPNANDKPTV